MGVPPHAVYGLAHTRASAGGIAIAICIAVVIMAMVWQYRWSGPLRRSLDGDAAADLMANATAADPRPCESFRGRAFFVVCLFLLLVSVIFGLAIKILDDFGIVLVSFWFILAPFGVILAPF